MATLSAPGIGSNLDVNGIVTKLMEVEAQPLTALTKKEAAYQAKLTAYGSVKGALSAFQTAAGSLNDPNKFLTLKASSSDTEVATVTASSTAVAGKYSINVTQLAESQKLVAEGQSSVTAAIGNGASTTLTFDFGTISGGSLTAYNPAVPGSGTYSGATFTSSGSGAKTVTIDSSNNSLTGIRDAVNAAKIGVTATIINDGGTNPYRLVFSSDTAGVKNSMKISVSADGDLKDLLGYDPETTQNLQQTAVAANTDMTVNGVAVSKASTVLSDVIPGVTLTALSTGTTKVDVSRDTSGVTTAVNAFVKSYNDLNTTLKNLTAYDASTKKGGVLLGDSAVRSIQAQLRNVMGGNLNYNGTYSTLSQVGLSFQLDGSLALDSSKLQTALNTDSASVAGLFAANGKTSDSLVSYVGSSSKTSAGSYALNLTQLSTQGSLAGAAVAGLVIGGSNDDLSVTLNGVTASITLANKTYSSASELALEIQSQINGATAFSSRGYSVSVAENAGTLTMTSARYGSASTVSVTGNAADGLFGAGRTATTGANVAGTLGGLAGVGSGQNLTGAAGNGAEGLKLLISGGTTGGRGTVDFSQGFAYQLKNVISEFIGNDGMLSGRTDGINQSIKDIASRREALNQRLASVEARYRKQFTALDTLVSNMQQTSAYLSQQLASLQS